MSIALSTILIFLLVLPGLAFRRFYYSGWFSKEYFKSSPIEIIIWSIPVSIVIHIAAYLSLPIFTPLNLFFYKVPQVSLNYELLIILMFKHSNDLSDRLLLLTGNDLLQILLYFIYAVFVGLISGIVSQFFIRRLKWDRKYKILRFNNEWHYYLSAQAIDFRKIIKTNLHNRKPGQVLSFVSVDALVQVGSTLIIYSGLLDDYKLSRQDNGLDLIYLRVVRRRVMNDEVDKKSGEIKAREKSQQGIDNDVYHIIPGDYFVLKYDDIINLNLSYKFENKKKSPRRYSWVALFLTIGILLFIYFVFYWVFKFFLENNYLSYILSFIFLVFILPISLAFLKGAYKAFKEKMNN